MTKHYFGFTESGMSLCIETTCSSSVAESQEIFRIFKQVARQYGEDCTSMHDLPMTPTEKALCSYHGALNKVVVFQDPVQEEWFQNAPRREEIRRRERASEADSKRHFYGATMNND